MVDYTSYPQALTLLLSSHVGGAKLEKLTNRYGEKLKAKTIYQYRNHQLPVLELPMRDLETLIKTYQSLDKQTQTVLKESDSTAFLSKDSQAALLADNDWLDITSVVTADSFDPSDYTLGQALDKQKTLTAQKMPSELMATPEANAKAVRELTNYDVVGSVKYLYLMGWSNDTIEQHAKTAGVTLNQHPNSYYQAHPESPAYYLPLHYIRDLTAIIATLPESLTQKIAKTDLRAVLTDMDYQLLFADGAVDLDLMQRFFQSANYPMIRLNNRQPKDNFGSGFYAVRSGKRALLGLQLGTLKKLEARLLARPNAELKAHDLLPKPKPTVTETVEATPAASNTIPSLKLSKLAQRLVDQFMDDAVTQSTTMAYELEQLTQSVDSHFPSYIAAVKRVLTAYDTLADDADSDEMLKQLNWLNGQVKAIIKQLNQFNDNLTTGLHTLLKDYQDD